VLGSHTREAQKVAAYDRWLLNGGEYQYKINIWEHFDWLLKTGWLLNRGDRQHRFDCLRQVGCLKEVTANTGLTVCRSLVTFTYVAVQISF